jgi:DNA modification methylase
MRPRIPGGEPGGEVIMSTARFIIGDTRDVVASMADNSVDLVMTSPP